jgi:hypothetical protein
MATEMNYKESDGYLKGAMTLQLRNIMGRTGNTGYAVSDGWKSDKTNVEGIMEEQFLVYENVDGAPVQMGRCGESELQRSIAPPTLSFGRVIEGQTIGDKFGDQS